MEDLIIKGGRGEYFTPTVKLMAETGYCEISGESYLEYTGEFYDRVLDWLRGFTQSSNQVISFHFKLSYFNTSSYKAILNLLKFLKQYQGKGGRIEIFWHFPDDDPDMLREGQDLADGSEIEMQMVSY